MQVVMLIIMTPVELIGKVAKPFRALAVRLFRQHDGRPLRDLSRYSV